MVKMTLVAGALFSLCLAAVPAEATVDHTYVSGKGTDTGGCIDQATACRSFAYALTQTSASGEIIVMDPADYSPVTITKSISIVADAGGPAGIILATGTAITISAGASDTVNLRGLTLEGEGTADVGIRLNSAGTLTVSDCFVRHFAGPGIVIIPSGALNASILNSVMSNNYGTGLEAIGQFSTLIVIIRNSIANNNGNGFFVTGATVTLAGSIATQNQGAGLLINQPSTVFSYGDNELNGNGGTNAGPLTPLAKR